MQYYRIEISKCITIYILLDNKVPLLHKISKAIYDLFGKAFRSAVATTPLYTHSA